jgi:hypothetical protein
MSLPSIFFTADEMTAVRIELNHDLPQEDVAAMSAMEPLKLSMLWAIIDGKEWDVALIDEFTEVFAHDEEWLNIVPEYLVRKIASLDAARMTKASKAWAATDEMQCSADEAEDVIKMIAALAQRAIDLKQSMYLYFCL